ncbi:hypothetical protein RPALISO_174 [Ruegeria phage RpAliso]|nr:hypothetical protein RPALISO_174 [Ruegeria phage RpAliso]
MNTLDLKIAEGLEGFLSGFMSARRHTGLTSDMLRSVKPGDIVICTKGMITYILRLLDVERRRTVRVVECHHNLGHVQREVQRARKEGFRGALHFDHHWIDCHISEELRNCVGDLRRFVGDHKPAPETPVRLAGVRDFV